MKIWRNYGLFFKYFKIFSGKKCFFFKKKITECLESLIDPRFNHYKLSGSFGQIWRFGITHCQRENENACSLDLAKRSRQHLYFVCFLIHNTPNIYQEISTDKRRKRMFAKSRLTWDIWRSHLLFISENSRNFQQKAFNHIEHDAYFMLTSEIIPRCTKQNWKSLDLVLLCGIVLNSKVLKHQALSKVTSSKERSMTHLKYS